MVLSLAARRRYNRAKGTAKYLGTRFVYNKALGGMNKLYTAIVNKKPSRNKVSRTRTKQTRRVERVLKNFSGSKYAGASIDCKTPVPKPAGTQPINYMFLNTGKSITSVGGSFANYQPLDLFQFRQGDGNTERVGDYMYIRHTKIKIEIQALPLDLVADPNGQQPVLQFRMMVVKSNRKYDSLGETPDPGRTLFLTTENEQFGYGVAGVSSTATTFANFAQPINKRDWLVYCDKRFKLSAPALGSDPLGSERTNNAFPKYNTKKYITLNLPVSKKCHFSNTDNTPDNLDTQWLIVIQCVHGSYCNDDTAAPRNWRMNLLGTTSAFDN